MSGPLSLRNLFDLATKECLQVQQVGGDEAQRCLLASELERNNVTVCGEHHGLATPKFVVVAFDELLVFRGAQRAQCKVVLVLFPRQRVKCFNTLEIVLAITPLERLLLLADLTNHLVGCIGIEFPQPCLGGSGLHHGPIRPQSGETELGACPRRSGRASRGVFAGEVVPQRGAQWKQKSNNSINFSTAYVGFPVNLRTCARPLSSREPCTSG